jgi:predicted nucleotidyltransferase
MNGNDVPKTLLDGVIKRLDPLAVYLFGSRARGDAGEDSDYDLYVVVDDEGAEEKKTGKAVSEARRNYRGPVDMLVRRKSTFDKRKDLLGTLEDIVQYEGRLVYVKGE